MSSSPTHARSPLWEPVLAYAASGVALVAAGALVAVLIAPLAGVAGPALTAPIWRILLGVAYIGLPAALLLVVALVILRVRTNRRRGARE